MLHAGFDDKYVTIIASGGRTGTTFFGDLLSGVIEESFSVHEPDLFAGLSALTWDRIRTFGIWHMLIGRLLGRTGIRNLTRNYLAGSMNDTELADAIRQHRAEYYRSIGKDYIIESYFQWYGILPALPRVFPHYKVVGLLRDPRTWVQSLVNQQGLYGNKKHFLSFGHKILNPSTLKDDAFIRRWPQMSGFEKSCWLWAAITGILRRCDSQDANMRLFRYEDIFLGTDRDVYVQDMLKFMTTFQDRIFKFNFDQTLLDKTKNSSRSARMSSWQKWPSELCRQMHDICGPLMRECGYGMESEWQGRL